MSMMMSMLMAGLLLDTSTATAPTTYPAARGYVNDYADILTQVEVRSLTAELGELEYKTDVQLVVITVKSLKGMSVQAYTLGLANAWSRGQTLKTKGVILLIAPHERVARIEVGHGLETVLPNTITGEILTRDVVSQLREYRMAEGIFAGTRSLSKALRSQQ